MAKVVAATEAFKTLAEVETRLGLSRSEDAAFFPEWYAPTDSLSTVEIDRLEVMRQRLLYHRATEIY